METLAVVSRVFGKTTGRNEWEGVRRYRGLEGGERGGYILTLHTPLTGWMVTVQAALFP